jgi:hypothetical protein
VTRVLNQMSQETAALFRAQLHGKPMPPPIAKAPRRTGKPKVMVPQLKRLLHEAHIVQLPIFLAQPKRLYPGRETTAASIKWRLRQEAQEYEALRDGVGRILGGYYQNGLPAGLRSIDYVRLSVRAGNPKTEMDDDNLGACFKPVRDAVCAFARWGADWHDHMNIIGQADGWLKQQGVQWLYRQAKYEANPRMFGIQIWLRFTPQSEQP